MNLLLDTHAFIWFIEGNSSLSKNALTLIEDKTNSVFVSIISLYEIAIKQKLGKLTLSNSLQRFFELASSQNIIITAISENDLLEYSNVPLIPTHKDPFDRLIIATAISRQFNIISIDENFSNYNNLANIIW